MLSAAKQVSNRPRQVRISSCSNEVAAYHFDCTRQTVFDDRQTCQCTTSAVTRESTGEGKGVIM